jgi:hypothetical protein
MFAKVRRSSAMKRVPFNHARLFLKRNKHLSRSVADYTYLSGPSAEDRKRRIPFVRRGGKGITVGVGRVMELFDDDSHKDYNEG